MGKTKVKPVVKPKAKKIDAADKSAKSNKTAAKAEIRKAALSKAPAAAAMEPKESKDKKAAKKAKASKRVETDDDLLVGESDGSEETIEGLEEMEAIDATEVAEIEEAVSDDTEDIEEAEAAPGDDEIILTDAEGRRLCRVRDCDQAAIVETYCRFHYLQNWKRIQVRRGILADGKLERYVEELTSRYPDKFLEMIRKDLRAEKDFLASIAELEIDESAGESDFEDESQSFIDEVRGVTEATISDDDEF